jgi:hypothetical protein
MMKIGFHLKDLLQLISFLIYLLLTKIAFYNHIYITLTTICSRSFVGGATNDEIDRDLVYAREPYNGNNTPNLVYSDYESRSTTDTAEENGEVAAVSPPRTEIEASSLSPTTSHHMNSSNYEHRIHHSQQYQPSSSTSNYHYNTNNDHNNHHQYQSPANSSFDHPHQHARLPPPTQLSQPEYTTTSTTTNNNIYPPFEFEEMPQDGRRDWWSYRSTTTA